MYRDEQFTFRAVRLCGMIVRDEGFTLMRDLALTTGLGRRGLSAERPRRPLRPKELSPPPFGVFLSREGTSAAQTMPRRDWWFGADTNKAPPHNKLHSSLSASTCAVQKSCSLTRSHGLPLLTVRRRNGGEGASSNRGARFGRGSQQYLQHRLPHSFTSVPVPVPSDLPCAELEDGSTARM
jgi:hypothetical protein